MGPPQSAAVGQGELRRGHGAKPAAARERAVLALLSARSVGEAARVAGIGERTLRTWMRQDVSFQDELSAARRATFEAGMSRVQALTARAVATLEDLLDQPDQPSTRLGAARTLLELAIQRSDADDLLRRVADLEQAQA